MRLTNPLLESETGLNHSLCALKLSRKAATSIRKQGCCPYTARIELTPSFRFLSFGPIGPERFGRGGVVAAESSAAGQVSACESAPSVGPNTKLGRVTAQVEQIGSQPDADGLPTPVCYVIAGVSGSGKSTIGAMLAQRLGCDFFDGDDFHPEANLAKMKSGQPLTDEDRWPWLHRLAGLLKEHVERREACVVACSALRRRYRDVLSGRVDGTDHTNHIAFVLLTPDKEELRRRTRARQAQGGHFMPASLLDSQLAALEPEPSAVTLRAPC